MEDNNAGAKFVYFIAGMGIGALAGILFAPKAGRETRQYLAERVEEGRDYVNRKGQRVREQASDYVERGRGILNQQKEHLSAAVEAGKQAYRAESHGKGSSD